MSQTICPLPCWVQITRAPELGALATLEASLRIAKSSLQAHLPELADHNTCLDQAPALPYVALACIILGRVDELCVLLDDYRRASRAAQARRPLIDDDDDGLPF